MSIVSLFILPFVLALGASHFVILFLVRLLGWKRAEVSTWKHLIALDVYANTLLGGDHRETISSRLGRHPECKACKFVCKILDLFDKDHCQKASENFRKLR